MENVVAKDTYLIKSSNKLVATVGSNSDIFTVSRWLYNFFKCCTLDLFPGTLYSPSTDIPCSSK